MIFMHSMSRQSNINPRLKRNEVLKKKRRRRRKKKKKKKRKEKKRKEKEKKKKKKKKKKKRTKKGKKKRGKKEKKNLHLSHNRFPSPPLMNTKTITLLTITTNFLQPRKNDINFTKFCRLVESVGGLGGACGCWVCN